MLEDKLLVAGGSEVLEDALEGMLVVGARVGGMAAEGCNGIAKVRTSP